MKHINLRRINTLLVVAIILVNGYIILAPFAPRIAFWWQDRGSQSVSKQLERRITTVKPPHGDAPLPKENRLIVPAMHLDEAVVEGKTARALLQGPWRRPHTSMPDRGGNTVISGHRFTYSNPRGSFYFLDRVKVGDHMALVWNGKKYLYRVSTVRVVPASATTIENQTEQPQLTLYSCTPLWLPKDRLVVVGVLEADS